MKPAPTGTAALLLVTALLMSQCGQPPGTGGSGGGTVAGQGGGSSGGTTTRDSELVSGSRLKAVVLKGVDNSRAPSPFTSFNFWDTQLNCFCGVALGNICAPARIGTTADSDGKRFYSDASCATPLAIVLKGWDQPLTVHPDLTQIDSPTAYLYEQQPDLSFVFHQVGVAYTGTVFERVGTTGGCAASQGPNNNDALVTIGNVVPASTFAAFHFAVEL